MVTGMGEQRKEYSVLVGGTEGKRLLRGPRHRRKDIKMDVIHTYNERVWTGLMS